MKLWQNLNECPEIHRKFTVQLLLHKTKPTGSFFPSKPYKVELNRNSTCTILKFINWLPKDWGLHGNILFLYCNPCSIILNSKRYRFSISQWHVFLQWIRLFLLLFWIFVLVLTRFTGSERLIDVYCVFCSVGWIGFECCISPLLSLWFGIPQTADKIFITWVVFQSIGGNENAVKKLGV